MNEDYEDDAFDRLLGEISIWADENRRRDAANQRARVASLSLQAAEAAQWHDLVSSWADNRVAALVHLKSGSVCQGTLVMAGVDFLVMSHERSPRPTKHLATSPRATVLMESSITALQQAPESCAILPRCLDAGQRRPSLRAATFLARISNEQPLVRVVLNAGQGPLVGTLINVGVDMLVIDSDGRAPSPIYVPLATVSEVSLLLSG